MTRSHQQQNFGLIANKAGGISGACGPGPGRRCYSLNSPLISQGHQTDTRSSLVPLWHKNTPAPVLPGLTSVRFCNYCVHVGSCHTAAWADGNQSSGPSKLGGGGPMLSPAAEGEAAAFLPICVCFFKLLAKYLMNLWTDLNETHRKSSLDQYLQKFTIWSQRNSRWLPKLMDLSQHKDGYNSVKITNIELKLGVVVAESYLSHIIWALTDQTRSVIRTLPLTFGVNGVHLLAKYFKR